MFTDLRGSEHTIIDALRYHVSNTPHKTGFQFLRSNDDSKLTYSALYASAADLAVQLKAIAKSGDRVLILLPTGPEFIIAWFACVLAGTIAVPSHSPQRSRHLSRLSSILVDCAPSVILTNDAMLVKVTEGLAIDCATTTVLSVDSIDAGVGVDFRIGGVQPDALAMLQYTSGSTGDPKGVMLTHANIIANVHSIAASGQMDAETSFVSWLPLFHDMGLFGKIILPVYLGSFAALMEPSDFIQQPVRWLRALSQYQGHVSAAPNSAFDLCVDRVSEEDKAELDLSAWRIAYNGSEPVRAETIERFCAAFAGCGFRATSMRPVYGMAEATLFMSGQSLDATVRALVRPQALPDVPDIRHVSCGRTWTDHAVRIVAENTKQPCTPGEVGEILFGGSSVGRGYWGKDDVNKRQFGIRFDGDDRAYMRTGDLGFLSDGDVFVTGRLKDIIIVAGRNVYPQDLERSAERACLTLQAGASVAFQVEGLPGSGIVFVGEVRRDVMRTIDIDTVVTEIKTAWSEDHGVDLAAVRLLKPLALPRTSSGKVRRQNTHAAFVANAGLNVIVSWDRSGRKPAIQTDVGGETLQGWLVERIASITQLPRESVRTSMPFASFGLESRDAYRLSGELEVFTGQSLSPTIFYDHPSIDALVAHMLTSMGSCSLDTAFPPVSTADTVAIIGMACRFPGADTPESFWSSLCARKVSIMPNPTRLPDGLCAGLLTDIAQFDAELFGLSGREAEMMDPQQRLLLEVTWEALERSGIAADRLAGSRTAVAVGISNMEYARLAAEAGHDCDPYFATGNALSIAANRISYAFDLRGPSWAVDTACSSSLVAVHQACRTLLDGQADLAIVGGANVMLLPQTSRIFADIGMLSPDGACRAFDAGANGYVRGEGAGVVILKRLSDAILDGNRIVATVRGSAMGQDGRSNGLTAPNGPAQEEVILAALKAAGIEPGDVGYIEAHGTGTALGDPIELNTLNRVYGAPGIRQAPCRIGSVKPNIGHLEAAAGIAGLIKVALAVQNREIPPTANFEALNPLVRLNGDVLAIADVHVPWDEARSGACAAVSSFGFGGTNAHMIIGPAPDSLPARRETVAPPYLLLASAQTPQALRARARQYLDKVVQTPIDELADFTIGMAVGRAQLPCRAAFLGDDRETLVRKLSNFIESADRVPPSALLIRFRLGSISGAALAAKQLVARSETFRRLLEAAAPPDLHEDERAVAALYAWWHAAGVVSDTLETNMVVSPAFACLFQNIALTPLADSDPGNSSLIITLDATGMVWSAVLDRFATVFEAGLRLDSSVLVPSGGYVLHPAPTYPFQRSHYWLPSIDVRTRATPDDRWSWEVELGGDMRGQFDGHRVHGAVLLPFSAYLDFASAAAVRLGYGTDVVIEDLRMVAPVTLKASVKTRLRTDVTFVSNRALKVSFHIRNGDGPWMLSADGHIKPSTVAS